MSGPAATRLRFSTMDALLSAFPTAAGEIGTTGDPRSPIEFVDASLRSRKAVQALTCLAYLLGKREAVWWGCVCLRQVALPEVVDPASLQAAEDWVRNPDEQRRRAALAIGMETDSRFASMWLARAAGWSGGTMSPDETIRLPPLPHLTAQAVRAALLLAAGRLPPETREARMADWASAGRRYALDPQSA